MAHPKIVAEPVQEEKQRDEPDRRDVELLAYSYWEQRGCPEDSAEEDWLRAEEDLRRGRVRRGAIG